MKECCFGPIRFLPGENKGKYPFCHSLYIEHAGVLIDPASDRDRLRHLRETSDVTVVWLSHWHEDHFRNLDLFEDVPLFISKQDAPRLADMESFLDGYGIESGEHRRIMGDIILEQFHFKPRIPAGFLRDGQTINLGALTVEVIHTPGHTPGHMSFFFKEPRIAFLGDYDLAKFGPCYGDCESSIQETISSVNRLKSLPAKVWLSSHETGIFESNPGEKWDRYLNVIQEREDRLLKFLTTPRTMEEIVNAWMIYGKPREPLAIYAKAEQSIMEKHLQDLIKRCLVSQNGNEYCLSS